MSNKRAIAWSNIETEAAVGIALGLIEKEGLTATEFFKRKKKRKEKKRK